MSSSARLSLSLSLFRAPQQPSEASCAVGGRQEREAKKPPRERERERKDERQSLAGGKAPQEKETRRGRIAKLPLSCHWKMTLGVAKGAAAAAASTAAAATAAAPVEPIVS